MCENQWTNVYKQARQNPGMFKDAPMVDTKEPAVVDELKVIEPRNNMYNLFIYKNHER